MMGTMRALFVFVLILASAAPRVALAQALDPDEEAARRHFARGLTHYDAGEYQAALAEFDAVKKFHDSPALDYNIARCYDRLERYEEAVAAYERYVTQKPDASDAAGIRERIATLRNRLAPRSGSVTPPAPTNTAPSTAPTPTAATPSPLVAAPVAAPAAAAVDEGARPRPLRRFAAPIAIGAGALVAAAIGAGLLGSVKSDYDAALAPSGCRPCSNDQISPLEQRAIAGYALLGVGGALAVVDVVLIGVLAAHGKKPSGAQRADLAALAMSRALLCVAALALAGCFDFDALRQPRDGGGGDLGADDLAGQGDADLANAADLAGADLAGVPTTPMPRLIAQAWYSSATATTYASTVGMTKMGFEIPTAGIVDGDLVLFIASIDNGSNTVWPNPIAPGFTQLAQNFYGSDGETFVVAYKLASGEPPKYTGTYGSGIGSGSSAIALIAVSGANKVMPIDNSLASFSSAAGHEPGQRRHQRPRHHRGKLHARARRRRRLAGRRRLEQLHAAERIHVAVAARRSRHPRLGLDVAAGLVADAGDRRRHRRR